MHLTFFIILWNPTPFIEGGRVSSGAATNREAASVWRDVYLPAWAWSTPGSPGTAPVAWLVFHSAFASGPSLFFLVCAAASGP